MTGSRRPTLGASCKMRDSGHQSQHDRLDDRKDRCGGAAGGHRRHRDHGRQSAAWPGLDRGLSMTRHVACGHDGRDPQASDSDAVIIACFDDTGLDAARCLTDRTGDRHWRGGLSHGLDAFEPVFGGDDACPLGSGAGTQPAPLWPDCALCPRAVVRSGRCWTGAPRLDACNRISAEIGRADRRGPGRSHRAGLRRNGRPCR